MGTMLTLLSTLLLVQAQPAPRPTPVTGSSVPEALLMLTPDGAGEEATLCTSDGRVCLSITPTAREDGGYDSAPSLVVAETGEGLRGDGGTITAPPHAEGRMRLSLWNRALLIAGNAEDAEGNYSLVIGFVSTLSTMYSGGGGQAQRLHLHRLHLGVGTPRLGPELLSVPLTGSLLIRACFGEEDGERRRGACHDEYNFGASLTLARGDAGDGELPVLVYSTQATAYPQTARRGEDSSAAPPLRASDLSHWRDPECSYTRRLRFNPATERYEMDRPAPDCSSYTVP